MINSTYSLILLLLGGDPYNNKKQKQNFEVKKISESSHESIERKRIAEEKRLRKAAKRFDDHVWCLKNNPCLKNTGKNWMTRHVQ